jgi:hypothetical protein
MEKRFFTMANRLLSQFIRPRYLGAMGAAFVIALATATPALAQEKVYFTAIENAQQVIVQKINAEKVRLDVATWMLVDGDIVTAIINKHKSGVPVRVLGDRITIFEQSDHNTRNAFFELANAGVPIRVRRHPTWFPEIMHWKAGIFVGQGQVEFGSANWTTFELAPWSATDFKDETAMFTDDLDIFRAFLVRFDEFWADPTYFEDFAVAYKAEMGTDWKVPMNISRVRLEQCPPSKPDCTTVPGMTWSQGSELINQMIAEINAEPTGGSIDMVSYRLTMPSVVDALIAKHNAGVRVRVFIEPTQYRNAGFPEFWLVGAMTDKLWMAGIPISQRKHQGLTHMKTLITSRGSLVASANFTKNWQRDHNYFISATQKPALHLAHKDRFNAMWEDATNPTKQVHYMPFQPQRPIEPQIPLPANGAVNVATTTRLEWNRAPFATSFDVYLGAAGAAMNLVGRVNAVVTDDPPATYSLTLGQALQPNTTYNWRVVSRTYASDANPALVMSSDTWTFTTGGSTGGGGSSGPYSGTPIALPGTIQAENFDNGGSGVAYFDNTVGNSGGQCRTAESVDIEATTDTGGGCNLGWVGAGEWLKYTVNVTTAGTYNLEFRIASPNSGGTFHLEVNGVDKTGPMTVSGTGDWQSWATMTKTGVSLAAGQQVWRLVFDNAGSSGAIANMNYIRVVAGGTTPPPTGSTPYGGTRAAIPGIVQAENFDVGGMGVAYNDTTIGNAGGAHRTNEDVDIEGTSDTGGGNNVGWMAVGEWLKYSVNVTAAGTYTLEFRVAASGAGGTFHLEVDGVDKTGPLTIPNTGGWQNWTTVSKTGVTLAAGNQLWRVVIDKAGSVVGNFNYMRAVASTGGSGGGTPTATPYGGTPAALPGTLQAENFDEGGANLGYFDTTFGNSGGEFRTTSDVDIESTFDPTGGGFNLGWVGATEWLQYTVNVTAAGTYTLQFRVASAAAGGTFRLEVNGIDKTGPMTVPNTGDWQTWTTIQKTGVTLTAGVQVWRLVMLTNSPATNGVGNINWIRVVSGTAAVQAPQYMHASRMPIPAISAGLADVTSQAASLSLPPSVWSGRRRPDYGAGL